MGDNHRTAGLDSQAVVRRAEQLDALDAILPFDRRDQLAALLTDDDVATMKHLASEGMGENTLRALASDLVLPGGLVPPRHRCPPRPAPEALLLKFVAHYLWGPVKRAEGAAHGMPADAEAGLRAERLLRSPGPHAPGTVQRRLTSWSILTRWRGLTGAFAAPSLNSALRLAVRASARPRQRKSKKAVTVDILAKLLQACAGDRLVDLRDHALLLTAFASGGRRRSEVAALRVEDLTDEEPVRANPSDKTSPPLPCPVCRSASAAPRRRPPMNEHVLLIGRPVTVLKRWLSDAQIKDGPVFRRIDRWGNIDRRALTPQSINLILKARCEQAGLDPALFSADGLRSGYLTEAANRGIPLPEAMQQSLHKSVTQAASYHNNAERKNGRAARLIV
ncbi:tyrosine-type recombinase/integrase [Sinorhizobium medicae]|nr:tyrosine-type recombinase/integrase [Sinorhizobium medicae]MDX0748101.1 tyrosine-type recombinase/integrase [Sinorhizobium medicae]